MFDNKKPTGILIGRYQGFHESHYELVKYAIDTYGQACIMVRDTQGTTEKDPFDYDFIRNNINIFLTKKGYTEGKEYMIMQIPNCASVITGRDLGYKLESIKLSEELEAISATKVREQMKKDGLI